MNEKSTQHLTLGQALRHLKRLKETIVKVTKIIKAYNSILKGGVREVDIPKAVAYRTRLKELLVDVKLALQEASRPIQRKIFEVAELKDQISFYRQLDCKHGKVIFQLGRYDVKEEREMDAVIRASEIEKACSECQRKMDRLYNEIDEFNGTHFVDLEEFPSQGFEDILFASNDEKTAPVE